MDKDDIKLVDMADYSGNPRHWSAEQLIDYALKLQKHQQYEKAIVLFLDTKGGYKLRMLKNVTIPEAIATLECAKELEVRSLIGISAGETFSLGDDDPPGGKSA